MSNENFNFNVDPVQLGEMVEKNTLLSTYGTIDELCIKLKTSKNTGLSSNQEILLSHERYFGRNFIPPKMPKKWYEYILEPLKEPMLLFILVGGIILFVSEMIKDPQKGGVDGVAIIIVVIIIVSVTAINDYSKEKQITNLQRSIKTSNTCTVFRNSRVEEIKTVDLVVGDIYMPKYGDMVPADGVVFVSNDLKIEESAITGETGLINKDPIEKPYLLAGTHVMDGSGKAVIVAVGLNSQTGRILKLMGALKKTKTKEKSLTDTSDANKDDKHLKGRSILQEKLNKLAFYLGIVGVVAGIIVILIYLIRFCISTYSGESAQPFKATHLMNFLEIFIEGFCVMVVAIPEGLPLAVTLSLAYSVRRMLKDNNLVRDLYSCETMGNTTTICSDKTGTLTTNRMTVIKMHISGKIISDFSNISSISEEIKTAIIMNICINKNQSSYIEPPKVPNGLPVQMGNKTDCALLGFLTYFHTDFDTFMTNFQNERIIKVFPFNSEKKVMSAIVDLGNNKFRILVKGAPEVLLRLASSYMDSDGSLHNLSNTEINIIQQNLLSMAQDSLRTILLAQRDFDKPSSIENIDESSLINDLVLLCFAGIEDPVRPDVPNAIKQCIRAGITVRMVTGDNIVTARSIAAKCGILGNSPDETIMDSVTFNNAIIDKNGKFDQDLFDKVWPNLKVLARSTPTDKFVLVKGILDSQLKPKQIVAVTGDGTNDAPALKRADVGFAMGITGTDIAKEASDIIIMDDNFASIVKAILWGRNVYDSISKFIQFQLTVNFATVILSIIGALLGYQFFTPAQLLWVNVIMDTFASLALATSQPTDSLLLRKPYSREKGLLSKNMSIFIIFHGLYQVAVILLIVFLAPRLFNIANGFSAQKHNSTSGSPIEATATDHGTMIFNIFVLMQIFNEINARMIHNERNVFSQIFRNKLFIIIIILSLAIQIFIITVGYSLFFATRLSVELWGWCLLIAFSVLVYHQIVVTNMGYIVSIPRRFRIPKGFDRRSISEDAHSVHARLLWIRGLKKLQQQLRVIEAFKEGLVVRREYLDECYQSRSGSRLDEPSVVIIENSKT